MKQALSLPIPQMNALRLREELGSCSDRSRAAICVEMINSGFGQVSALSLHHFLRALKFQGSCLSFCTQVSSSWVFCQARILSRVLGCHQCCRLMFTKNLPSFGV